MISIFYPFIKQESENDCGFACVAMLVNYYHKANNSISEIKNDCNIYHHNDLSIFELVEIAKTYNIDLRAFETNVDYLQELDANRPLIVVVNNEGRLHFQVIYEIKKNSLLIADPNNDRTKWVDIEDFRKIFCNVIIQSKLIQKTKIISKQKKYWNMFLVLKDYKVTILLLFLTCLLSNILLIINKTFIKIYIDQLSRVVHDQIMVIFITFFTITLIKLSLDFCFHKSIFLISLKVTKQVQTNFLERVHNLDTSQFNKYSESDWLKKVEDTNKMCNFVTIRAFNLLFSLVMVCVCATIFLFISKIILLFLILENIVIAVVSSYFIYLRKKPFNKLLRFSIQYQEKIITYFRSFKNQKARGLSSNIIKDTTQTMDNFLFTTNDINKINVTQRFYQNMVSQIINLFILYYSFVAIQGHNLDLSDLLFYLSLSYYFSDFTSNFIDLAMINEELKTSYQRISGVLFWNKTDISEKIKKVFDQKIQSIDAQNLNYSINGDPVWHNLNLRFENSSLIKGRNGSGKTSLLTCLGNLNRSYTGSIVINNEFNINDYSELELRDRIILIEQNEYLFSGTVASNIYNLKSKDITTEHHNKKILQALQQCKIGLEDICFNNGSNMSKGQRQVVAFLSAINKNYDVYLMDEALSNVDGQSKKYLIELFFILHPNKILVYVGHDRELEPYFNNIINLEKI